MCSTDVGAGGQHASGGLPIQGSELHNQVYPHWHGSANIHIWNCSRRLCVLRRAPHVPYRVRELSSLRMEVCPSCAVSCTGNIELPAHGALRLGSSEPQARPWGGAVAIPGARDAQTHTHRHITPCRWSGGAVPTLCKSVEDPRRAYMRTPPHGTGACGSRSSD